MQKELKGAADSAVRAAGSSREEFDTQTKVLAKTRAKLEELERGQ